MGVNTEKIKACFRAIGSFLGNVLTIRVPLWLWLVVCLVSVLLSLLVACNATKGQGGHIDSAVVGYADYHGHNYIVFCAGGSFSVTHDPDCICKLLDQ